METKNKMVKSTQIENVKVKVCGDRNDLGVISGKDITKKINEILSVKEEIRIIFASAPSQEGTMQFLKNTKDIDWSRVVVFDMDEYIGLSGKKRGSFAQYLDTQLFNEVKPKKVNLINGINDPEAECKRYAELLVEKPIDIVLCGIGENGHIAFNEPEVADFNDKEVVKIVTLEEKSRMQQVHDECFKTIDDVPKRAITVTIPMLFSAKYMFCMAPGENKKEAVKKVLTGPVTQQVPASIIRKHHNCIMYIDEYSNSII